MLELNEIKKNEGESMFELIIRSNDEKTLEKISNMLITSVTRCNICDGNVTRSGEMYLCLSGCGHVNGIK